MYIPHIGIVSLSLGAFSPHRFLWAHLQLQELCDPDRIGFEEDVREELGRLPRKLEDIYSKIYQKICESASRGQLVTKRALKWLLCAQRPLTPQELVAAASPDNMGGFSKVSETEILKMCRNLVILDGEMHVFRFSHMSVREYLETVGELASAYAHAAVAETCLFYLCSSDVHTQGNQISAITQHGKSLQHYVNLYWAMHCQLCSEESRCEGSLREFLLLFLSTNPHSTPAFSKWMKSSRGARMFLNSCDPLDDKLEAGINAQQSPFFVVCAFGFSEVLSDQAFHSANLDFQARNSRNETGLYIASKNGNHKVVKLILDKDLDINGHGGPYGTALQAAAYGGHMAVIRLLLEKGANINGGENDPLGSALLVAVHRDHEEVVQLLINYGADINAQTGKHGTALDVAAVEEKENLVSLLLLNGASVSTQPFQNGSLLFRSAQTGNEKVLRLLAENGAMFNIERNEYDMALELAVTQSNEELLKLLLQEKTFAALPVRPNLNKGLRVAVGAENENIARLLVERGADINADDNWLGTVLQAAVATGNLGIVAFLLEMGADINARSKEYGSALHAAISNCDEIMVEMLLELGADVNVAGGDHESPLNVSLAVGNQRIIHMLTAKGAKLEDESDFEVILPMGEDYISVIESDGNSELSLDSDLEFVSINYHTRKSQKVASKVWRWKQGWTPIPPPIRYRTHFWTFRTNRGNTRECSFCFVIRFEADKNCPEPYESRIRDIFCRCTRWGPSRTISVQMFVYSPVSVKDSERVGPPLDVTVREFSISETKLLQCPIDVHGQSKEFPTAPLGIHTIKNIKYFFTNLETWIEALLPAFMNKIPHQEDLYYRTIKAAYQYSQKGENPRVNIWYIILDFISDSSH